MSKNLYVGILVFFGCFLFIGNVNAVSITTNTCSEGYYDINNNYYTYAEEITSTEIIDRHNQVYLFSYGNHVVYCTQKGVPYMNGSKPFEPSTKQISSNYMARSLAYGYYASTGSVACSANSTTDFRVATQVMVHFTASGRNNWQDLTRAQIQATLTGTRKDEVSLLAYNLKQTILNYKKIPSFAASSADDVEKYTLNYDEKNYRFSSSITDTTGILSFVDTKKYTWDVDSVPSKVTATKSGNTLTITSKDDSVTTPVTLTKTYIDHVSIYERIEGNSVQDVAYVNSVSTAPQKAYVGYKYEPIGKATIEIEKVDSVSKKPIKDVEFGIYSDNKCTVKATDYLGTELSSKKTNADGKLSWNNLYYDEALASSKSYYIKELSVPIEYENDEVGKCKEVKVKPANSDVGTANKVPFNITNQPKGRAEVHVHKIDKYTGKNMKGVTFGIFSDNKCTVKATDYKGNVLNEVQTDKNGFASWKDLHYRIEKEATKTYYVKELKVVDGYTVDSEQMIELGAGDTNCVPVTVKPMNQEVGVTTEEVQALYNIPYGNITILKQDEDTGAAVEGVEFKLSNLNIDRTPVVDIKGNVVENVVTNEWGVAVFEDIPYGEYVLEEVKTPASHKPLEKPIEFILDKNTDALKYKKHGIEALPIIDTDDKFIYTLGDPTKDKKIDNSDLEILNKIVKGETKDITIDQKYASDVNKDGKVNSEDVDLMTKYIAGETNLIQMEEIEVTTDDLVPPETYKLGDPTDDGVIDNNDLAIIEKIIKASETPAPEEEQAEEPEKVEITKVERYASDVSLDGVVDTHDKELMVSYLGGNKAAFEALKEIAYPDQFQVKATLVVTNVPIDMKISKQAITNSKEIKGATIVIKTKDGKVFHKYKSTGKPVEFYIPAGEYTLIEEIAPKGYENLKTEVKFSVGTDGNIKLLSAKSKMYKLVKSEEETDTDLDHLIIYNNLKKVIVPNTGSTIAFVSIIGGTLLVASGTYVIFKRYNTVN